MVVVEEEEEEALQVAKRWRQRGEEMEERWRQSGATVKSSLYYEHAEH